MFVSANKPAGSPVQCKRRSARILTAPAKARSSPWPVGRTLASYCNKHCLNDGTARQACKTATASHCGCKRDGKVEILGICQRSAILRFSMALQHMLDYHGSGRTWAVGVATRQAVLGYTTLVAPCADRGEGGPRWRRTPGDPN